MHEITGELIASNYIRAADKNASEELNRSATVVRAVAYANLARDTLTALDL